MMATIPTVYPLPKTSTQHARAFGVGAFLLCNALAHADPIYVSYSGTGAGLIEQYDSSGNGSVLAGSGFSSPEGIAFDSSGNLYVANSETGTILEVSPTGQESVFAGSAAGLNPRGGQQGLAFDQGGNLYVAGGNIVRISPAGNGSVFATPSNFGLEAADGGLAFDSNGNLFVGSTGLANENNGEIEEYNSSGQGRLFANGLNFPVGLAFDANGDLYVANYYGNNIEKFDANGHGSIFANLGSLSPYGLACDGSGNLYVAVSQSGVNNLSSGEILKFDPAGNESVFANDTFTVNGGEGLIASYIAVEVPEPSPWAMLALGAGLLLIRYQRRRLQAAGGTAL